MSTINILYYVVWLGLTFYTLFFLLLHRREPYSTLSWMLLVLLLPIIGPFIYFLFGPQRFQRTAQRRKAEITQFLRESTFSWKTKEDTESPMSPKFNGEDLRILRLAREVSEFGATPNNGVELIQDPEEALRSIEEAIGSAKHFIHMEYYIISSDEVTQRLFQCLIKALERGVEVRILYDSVGSLFLKRIHFRKLLEKGAQITGFLPLQFLPQRFHIHFRNHRKILIIDGKIAFTGGTNLGKEYLGKRFAKQWRDYTVRISGAVVLQLQDVFAKDWQFTTQEDLFDMKYYPNPSDDGKSLVQVIESGPDSAFHTLHQAVFMAINSAEHEILLTTPYFIPDPAMEAALISAALRGVNVTLLLPEKSDAPIVRWASRSFYASFLKAGVKIFEYQPTVLHAKLLTVDDRWTILGSANMDTRSFKLNFELNLMVYGGGFAAHAESHIRNDLSQSKEIKQEVFCNRPTKEVLLENFCRLFSPIL